jgi:hypothetical protein
MVITVLAMALGIKAVEAVALGSKWGECSPGAHAHGLWWAVGHVVQAGAG